MWVTLEASFVTWPTLLYGWRLLWLLAIFAIAGLAIYEGLEFLVGSWIDAHQDTRLAGVLWKNAIVLNVLSRFPFAKRWARQTGPFIAGVAVGCVFMAAQRYSNTDSYTIRVRKVLGDRAYVVRVVGAPEDSQFNQCHVGADAGFEEGDLIEVTVEEQTENGGECKDLTPPNGWRAVPGQAKGRMTNANLR